MHSGAAYNYTTYRTAAAQLGKIASKVAVAVKEAAHCVDWWAEVKANLDDMKSSTFLVGQKIKVDHEQADGWKIIGDKFTLYIYNVGHFSSSVRDNTHHTNCRIRHTSLAIILVSVLCQEPWLPGHIIYRPMWILGLEW